MEKEQWEGRIRDITTGGIYDVAFADRSKLKGGERDRDGQLGINSMEEKA